MIQILKEFKVKKTFLKAKFPTIYRFIPNYPLEAQRITATILLGALSLAFLIEGILVGVDLYNTFKAKQLIESERVKIQEKVAFWEDVALKYTDYRDAYFQLAILEYRLGNTVKAQKYLEKTLEIDPNFEEGREFEKLLK